MTLLLAELGAVYRPVVEIVPVTTFPPATPFTSQIMAVFEPPVTVAVNCCDPPAARFADAGRIEIEIWGGGGGGGGDGDEGWV
jgi:hypothetical protein